MNFKKIIREEYKNIFFPEVKTRRKYGSYRNQPTSVERFCYCCMLGGLESTFDTYRPIWKQICALAFKYFDDNVNKY